MPNDSFIWKSNILPSSGSGSPTSISDIQNSTLIFQTSHSRSNPLFMTSKDCSGFSGTGLLPSLPSSSSTLSSTSLSSLPSEKIGLKSDSLHDDDIVIPISNKRLKDSCTLSSQANPSVVHDICDDLASFLSDCFEDHDDDMDMCLLKRCRTESSSSAEDVERFLNTGQVTGSWEMCSDSDGFSDNCFNDSFLPIPTPLWGFHSSLPAL